MIESDLIAFVVLVFGFAGLLAYRITVRLDYVDERTTSKDLRDITNSGIFTEHGMVRTDDKNGVRAQSKRSKTYVNCAS